LTIGRLILLSLFVAGCASPVFTSPVFTIRTDPQTVYRELNRGAAASGEPSWPTRNVLRERGLLEDYDKRPEAALADLHRAMVAARGDLDALFALAELSYLHGRAAAKREYHLAAAVYAWAFLFPEGLQGAPDRFDPRLRMAADVYDLAIVAGFASEDGAAVVPAAGGFDLPFGRIDVSFDRAALRAGDRELYDFVPTAELEVQGLGMRYRRAGVGASLAAATRPIDTARPGLEMIGPRMKVQVTALLRILQARRALVQSQPLTATLELHLAWDAESVSIAGEQVPLEADPTAALALSFTGIPILELEMFGFLGRLSRAWADRPPLISTTPYKPGLIPVVFVHGTESSVLRWAEMYNRLLADAELRNRYQFWFFQYDSGNPIVLSSLQLRKSLTAAFARLDPGGTDAALRQTVLVGHSQGGLLVKMQVITSGDHLWNAASRKPLAELTLMPGDRELLQHAMFVEPVPQVSRVVFICTPQRGSFVAASTVIEDAVRWLLNPPRLETNLALDIAANPGAVRSAFVPSAVDNMSPSSNFIRGLEGIPVTPSVTVNSIIAVDTDGPVEQGNDGVVQYSSAHIEPVESELVVRSPHSAEGNPHTIEEVRRILRKQAGLL
jgi:pimeloyl-ACP methyl ester carboxylesterase